MKLCYTIFIFRPILFYILLIPISFNTFILYFVQTKTIRDCFVYIHLKYGL